MNVFKYKKINLTSPKNLRNHKMYQNKTPLKKADLDEFVGKFLADEQMNVVELKHEFKDKRLS